VVLEDVVKHSRSAERQSQELEDFKELVASYERLQGIPTGNPEEAAAVEEALSHYRAMGAGLWKMALLVTEHLPQETRSRELAWMKQQLQSAGMLEASQAGQNDSLGTQDQTQ
jgi:hypothetical protein